MKQIEKNLLENIERMFFPAVFLLVNEIQKTVWISRTNCLAEGLLRTLRSIKSGDHKLKNLVDYKLLYLEVNEELRYKYSALCREYQEAGYQLLNRSIKYKIKKRTISNMMGYYTQVVLGTRNYDIKILKEFLTIKEADEFIKQWRATN